MKLRVAGLTHPAWAILASVLMLEAIGLLCIYATEIGRSGPPTNTIKQFVFIVAGFFVTIVVLRVGHEPIGRWAYPIFVLAMLFLVPLVIARFVSLGDLIPNRRGAHRWIQLPGFQLQPSEFMKVAHIIALAAYLRYRSNHRRFAGLLIPVFASLVPMVLILLEPDLGTVLLMAAVLMMMLYVAGARRRHFATLILVGVALLPLFWLQLRPYQKSRILGVVLQSATLREAIISEPDKYRFLGTERQAREWEFGAGMQLMRSKAALGSGGLKGQGWGHGTYVEYNFLPDKHNDFIFAIIGHQWGTIGCLLVLACYTIIVISGVEIAAATTEPFARLLAVGVISLLSAQVAINVGMTLGLMPITGMTLPFVSYGGSSLLTNCLGISLLISVSRRRPYLLAEPPFDFDRRPPRDAPVRPTPTYRTGG